ncbi:MAG TPA: TfoX/Sxy family protein [Actinocrinis sp.]|nr:TfoX/Sxy family protein [Actinocrinis sp.]
MAYDAALAGRLRALLPPGPPFREKAMFGGLAFLLNGRMCAGVVGGRVVLWLGREAAAAAIAQHPAAAPMDFTGRVMHNFVYLDPAGVADDAELREWLADAVAAVGGRAG